MLNVLEQLNQEYTTEVVKLGMQLVLFETKEAFEEADAIQKRIDCLIDNTSLMFHQIGEEDLDIVRNTFKTNYNQLIQLIRDNKDNLEEHINNLK